MLEVADLQVYRGRTHVLKGVSLTVGQGEIVALIGANGAGKSTTLLTLSGILRPRGGTLRFTAEGESLALDEASTERIVRAGIVQCPEGRQIFGALTVAENLAAGAYARRDRAGVAHDRERVLTLFPVLAARLRQQAGSLSGGEQMMLAIGRALVAGPRLLLLDEPSLGLAPQVIEQIFDTILALHAEGVTILLVEQNAAMALEIADRAYVLESGTVALSGSGQALLENESVRAAYLGGAR